MNPIIQRRNFIVVYISLLLLSAVLTSVFSAFFLYVRTGACLLVVFSASLIVVSISNLRKENQGNTLNNFNIIDLAVFLFAIYLVIRTVFSPESNQVPENIIIRLIAIGTYVIIRINSGNNRESITKSIIVVFIIFCVLQSLFSIAQFLGLVPNLFDSYRIGGTFGNPGDLANVLIIGYSLSLGCILNVKSTQTKRCLGVAFVFIAIAIILSNARTACLALIIVTIFLFKDFIPSVYRKFRYKHSSVVLYSMVLVLIMVGSFLAVQLYQYKQDSSNGRLFIYKLCTELIAEKPLFGHGYDTFIPEYTIKQANYFKEYPNDLKNGMLAGNNVFAFNDYLQTSIELGLLGLLLLLFPMALMFKQGLTKKDNSNPWLRIIRAPIVGILVCMLFSYPLQNPVLIIILFVLIALYTMYTDKCLMIVRVSNIVQRLNAIIIIMVLVVVLSLSVIFIRAGINWKQTYASFIAMDKAYLSQYERIFKVLKYDKRFLYHYGVILFTSGEYEKCITHYEKYINYCIKTDMIIYLAESYERLGDYNHAEKYYQTACNIVPHLFVPKYKLFKLFTKTGQLNKARNMAYEIQGMPVKIFSSTVQKIKTEINNYLINGIQNNTSI